MENEVVAKQTKPNLFAVIWSPGQQFERIRQNPKVWIPLLFVVILNAASFIIAALSLTAKDLTTAGLPIEQAEMVLGFTKVTTIVTGFISPIFTIFISTAIYFMITKIAKKDTTFMQLLSMSTFIFFIPAIGSLLNSILWVLLGGSLGSGISLTSLAGVLNSDSPILGAIELFAIWKLFLIAMGLHKVGQLSKTAGIITAVVFFLISLGFAALGALFSGMAGM
ncbi:Yip1 family protein [Bacillus benzoevorans]|uniref:Yip1 domain-containing protein n=1 Tax=Bacillus benzoevorans TaxID=1456 RepID=A0A7X0HVH5_9BACI|nr:Yip1 family protein [Bacillus benzoevorans]MBB6446346.1 hypothetical protein [Bacillus benzoevorans]